MIFVAFYIEYYDSIIVNIKLIKIDLSAEQ